MRRTIIIIIIVGALAGLGYFGYRQYQQNQAAASSSYQTIKVTHGDLTASVGATGTVRAKQSVTLNWQTTGRVAEVKVKEGDLVKKGQVLATLDESSLPQTVILARADLVTAQRNLATLINSDSARAQAQQTLVAAQKALDDAKTQRESKQYARASDATVEEARANYTLAKDATKKATQIYDRVDSLPEDDPNRASAYANLANAQKKEDTALANLNYLLGKPDNMEIAQADAAVAVAEAKLGDAQREYARLQNGADPQDIEAAKARVAALQATISSTSLTAPIDGVVTDLNLQPGDNATPAAATTSAIRIDDISQLDVDVQITEVDINRIKYGQPATLSLDAVQEQSYMGKVTQVARVGQAQQGVVNFLVTVTLNKTDGGIQPGMTAAVNIITDMVQNVIVIPNRAVRLNNGQRVVYVLRNGQAVMTPITLGRSADTTSELVSGDIKEGDLLILNPPVQRSLPIGGPRTGGGGGGSSSSDSGGSSTGGTTK